MQGDSDTNYNKDFKVLIEKSGLIEYTFEKKGSHPVLSWGKLFYQQGTDFTYKEAVNTNYTIIVTDNPDANLLSQCAAEQHLNLRYDRFIETTDSRSIELSQLKPGKEYFINVYASSESVPEVIPYKSITLYVPQSSIFTRVAFCKYF